MNYYMHVSSAIGVKGAIFSYWTTCISAIANCRLSMRRSVPMPIHIHMLFV